MLSLRGVNAVLLNQWSMDAVRNHAAAMALISDGIGGGQVIGKAYAEVSGKLFDRYEGLINDVALCQAKLAGLEERYQRALDEEAAREAAEQEEGGDEEQEQDVTQETEDPPEVPSEEEVEAEKTRLQELMASRDETYEQMRGLEGCLALALYGIPTL